jgi:hypothetical protein
MACANRPNSPLFDADKKRAREQRMVTDDGKVSIPLSSFMFFFKFFNENKFQKRIKMKKGRTSR